MSAQIRIERNDYYAVLERTQKGGLDISDWLDWFLGCLTRAMKDAQLRLDDAIKKARFWERFGKEALNERQISVLQRFMREDWEGKLTSSKWAKIAACSQDTAGRDINNLVERGALKKDERGGRSTSYSIVYRN
jgi:Fic family protein